METLEKHRNFGGGVRTVPRGSLNSPEFKGQTYQSRRARSLNHWTTRRIQELQEQSLSGYPSQDKVIQDKTKSDFPPRGFMRK